MTGRTFTLAEPWDPTTRHLRTDMAAPLPLGYAAAIERALILRAKGNAWTWTIISEVMAEYHGIRRCPKWWREHLRAVGAPARPRGAPFNGRQCEAV